MQKAIALKPQDFVVALKLAVNSSREFLLVDLARELAMPISVTHGCIRRAEESRLISRSAGSIRPVRSAVQEFAIHGVKYAFPGRLGQSTRGIRTAVGAPVMAEHFEKSDVLPPVWPTPDGDTWGPQLLPLHSSVPNAAKADQRLYDALALIDAVRIGAAREREMASRELEARL